MKLKSFNYPVAIIVFIIASVYVITFLAPVSFFQSIPLCPLKFWTGIPCPLCGMSRAFASISHGDFNEAVRYHPLSPLFYMIGILSVIFLVLNVSAVWPLKKTLREDKETSFPRPVPRSWQGAGGKRESSLFKKLSPLNIALFLSVLLIAVWMIRYNPFF